MPRAAALTRPLAVAAALVLLTLPSAASAKEQVLTLYSPPITSVPYVHENKDLVLRPDGRQAPARPGYLTGFKEMVLVDSLDPDAKPLSNAKFMIHHFVYSAPDRVKENLGGCWPEVGFVGGRGEEHPSGQFSKMVPPEQRAKYGIPNMTPTGEAPTWRLRAMVMNHVKRTKRVYVRTRVYYSEQPRIPITPVVLGDCSLTASAMSYDVPGGGRPGSNYVRRSTWTVPDGFRGRVLLGASHHHGGAKYQQLSNRTCGRRIFRARAYYGRPDHIYNRIRPILHEPGPIANGSFGTNEGVPVSGREVIENTAVHDNSNLHVAVMGFWALTVVRDDSVTPCGPMPRDIKELTRPRRFAKRPDFGLRVPQLVRPRGPLAAVGSDPLAVGDDWFRPGRIVARAGQPVTWQFVGARPHSVTVANGPRGFSSLYTGQTSGTYSFTPKVRGTYRLTCLVHPTAMGQTLVVK